MRHSVFAALTAILLWAVLALLVIPADSSAAGAAPPRPTLPIPETAPETGAAAAPLPQAAFDPEFTLRVQKEDGIQSMDLQSYLTGVLLAEMPASFDAEAQKAQAVACRTYALSRCQHPRHTGAAVCTDSRCCQSWRNPAKADADAREKAEAAVRETDGLVLLYQGKLIDATFFSCSGGRTEDASAVWGGELPYLQAVESPGEESAAHFTDEARIPLAEFRATLERQNGEVQFSGDPGSWVEAVQYTAGGGVGQIRLGGRSFRGTELRKAFSLRSTAFDLTLNQAEAIFTTRGNGHRVGMSQYGAEAMARAGNDFESILKWYYQGVTLIRADEME
jgi:stage II sporulation protein D